MKGFPVQVAVVLTLAGILLLVGCRSGDGRTKKDVQRDCVKYCGDTIGESAGNAYEQCVSLCGGSK